MEVILDSDNLETKIERLEAEAAGFDYEIENTETEDEEIKEQPFDAEKIRVDQQMLSVKYML